MNWLTSSVLKFGGWQGTVRSGKYESGYTLRDPGCAADGVAWTEEETVFEDIGNWNRCVEFIRHYMSGFDEKEYPLVERTDLAHFQHIKRSYYCHRRGIRTGCKLDEYDDGTLHLFRW